jgi:3-methyladenine DNA glycosylase/8-oxoguanine DNA glycosylase
MLSSLSKKDKKLKELIEQVAGGFSPNIEEAASPFEAISEAIVYQQLTGKAAATIYGRFKALFNSDQHPSPQQILEAPEAVLRSAGLSGSKIKALKDLAEKSLAGLIPSHEEIEKLSDEEIIEILTAVKGVGTWTAHMFLMFRLGRLDVMPSGDYGVRMGYAITYGKHAKDLPTTTQLEKHGELWRPFRSVGSWYMWRAVELHRALNAATKISAPPKKRLKKSETVESGKKSIAKKPAAKKPDTGKPVTKKPVKKKPVAKKPAAKKTVAKKPVAKKPATKKSTRASKSR